VKGERAERLLGHHETDAAMFLGTISNVVARPLLHKEDYSFGASIDPQTGVVRALPKENWLLGFKDRVLERDYLNELGERGTTRIILGYLLYMSMDWLKILAYIVRVPLPPSPPPHLR